jgi:WD40 repeat protein
MINSVPFNPPDFTGATFGAYRAVELMEARLDFHRYEGVGRTSRQKVEIWVLPKAPSRLEHPYLLPTLETGALDGYSYSVLANLEGGTLAEHLPRRTFTVQEVARWMMQLAGVLAYMHRNGFTHGQLSAETIGFDGYENLFLMEVYPAPGGSLGDDLEALGLLLRQVVARVEKNDPDYARLSALAYTHPSMEAFMDSLGRQLGLADERLPRLEVGYELRPLWIPAPVIYQRGQSPIRGCAWVGDQFLSASEDGVIFLMSPRASTSLIQTDSPILKLCASESRIATVHADENVRLWSMEGELLQEIAVEGVTDCSLSGNGRFLAIASTDGILRLFDTFLERESLTIPHNVEIACCCLSESGQLVLVGGADGVLRLWTTMRGELLQVFNGHSDPVTACDLKGELVFSGTQAGQLGIWDILMEEPPMFIEAHRGEVVACSVAEINGQPVGLSVGRDEMAALWTLRSASMLSTLVREGANCGALSEHGALIGQQDGSLRVLVPRMPQASARLRAFRAAPPILFSADEDRFLRQVVLSTGETVDTLELLSMPRSLEVTDLYIFVGCDNGLLYCYNRENHRLRWEASAHQGAVNSLMVLEDGRIVSGGSDGILALWNPVSGARISAVAVHSANIRCGVTWDGLAVIGTQEGAVTGWDVLAGKQQHVYGLLEDAVATMSTGGSWLGAGLATGTVALWKGKDAHPAFRAHENLVTALSIAPGGRHMVTAGLDHYTRLWSLDERALLHEWQTESPVSVCAWIDDFRFVLANENGSLMGYLWYEFG